MNLLSTFIATITDIQVYKKLPEKSLTASLGYCYSYLFIIALLSSLIIYLFVLPQTLNFLSQNVTHLKNNLPQNAHITLSPTNGLELENFTLPFSLHLLTPQDLKLPITNLLVIDPHASLKDASNQKTLFLLTQDQLVISNLANPDLLTSLPLSDLPQTITITPESINQLYQQFLTFMNNLSPYFFWLLLITIFTTLGLARLISLLIYSFVAYSFAQLAGRNYPYLHFLKITCHTIILAQILEIINLLILPGNFPMFTTAIVGLNLIATFNLPKNPT